MRALETVAYRCLGGRHLEEWVDFKVGRPTRAQRTATTQFSQLLDPSWQIVDKPQQKESTPLRKSKSPAAATEEQQGEEAYRFTSRDQLPQDALDLDSALFPWLQSMVKGRLNAVLYDLPLECFSAGVWAIYKNIQGSKLLLKWAVLDDIEALTFDGDVKTFKIQYQLLLSDVEQYQITGRDIAHRRLLRCGISAYVAKDIAKDLGGGGVNVMDVLSTHLDALDATVSQAAIAQVNNTTPAPKLGYGKCTRCGRDDHLAKMCCNNYDNNRVPLDTATKTAEGRAEGIRRYEETQNRGTSNRRHKTNRPSSASQANSVTIVDLYGLSTDQKVDAMINLFAQQNKNGDKCDLQLLVQICNIYKEHKASMRQ
jgi:hypothetical protein